MNRRLKIVIAIVAALLLVTPVMGFLGALENKKLIVTEYEIKNEKIPDSFVGYKILQISDFHNHENAEFVDKIVNKVIEIQPDIIAVTGDLVDSRNTKINIAIDFISKIKEVAPVYYVTGNHEGRIQSYEQLKGALENSGVTALENRCVALCRGNSEINLIGINDPSFDTDLGVGEKQFVSEHLSDIPFDGSLYTIALFHRPELCSAFEGMGVDLLLSGHSHGGQIRLPFIGGILAPDQGLFPKYDGGLYEENGFTMLVSRGIGNSIFPIRLNNPPELVLVTLGK
ncbi:MAG: metallophosphoesterase [Clostridiales bacterium]|nr:metallophosphoesterase [Clostridiales bacterium]